MKYFTFLNKGLLTLVAILTGAMALQAQTGLTISMADSNAVSCQDDAYATINVSGGVGPYTAYWLRYIDGVSNPPGPLGVQIDTVSIGLSADSLAPGYYQIHVYDSSIPTPILGYYGVYIQGSFSVSQVTTPATCTNADGKIKLTVLNTVGPYSFDWSTGVQHNGLTANSDSVMNLLAGYYSCTVTDGNGCYVSAGGAGTTQGGLYVYATSPIVVTGSATPSNCYDGTATVVATLGTAPYSYVWSTTPAQFGVTATGLSPGYVFCTVTDAVGCSRQQYVSIPAGPNYLQATSNISQEICGGTPGAIDLTVTGGVTPYTYLWSNGSTSQDQTGLSSGSYSVVISDAQGCSLTAYKYVPLLSTVQVTATSSYTGCAADGGSINANVTGGTAPYTFTWNLGSITTSSASNLAPGYYYVTATDANGCVGSDYEYLQLPEACRVHIRGRVFNDLNGNCAHEPNEGYLANVLVNATPGYHYGSTDGNGYFDIEVDPGMYDLTTYVPNNWEQICPTGPMTIAVDASVAGSTISGNDFYLQPDSVFNDFQVYMFSGPARPGFPVNWYVNVRNAGTTTLSGVLDLNHDVLTTYTGSNPAVTSYSAATHTATWSIPPMSPQANYNYYLYSTLSTSAVLGDSIHGTATISFPGVDVNMANNTSHCSRLITGSYDPNDKAVAPRGLGEEGRILYEDSVLHYTIRFQNTGTDTAFTVIVRDTLDASLDVPSFRFEGSSHPMTYTISGEGIVTFVFANILLPDSFVNEAGSHGVLSYFIKRKMDIPFGTEINNTGYIYFDFNPPIQTNTTRNTLFDPTLGIKPIGNMQFNMQPNPTFDRSRITLQLNQADDVQVSVLDVSGRLIQNRKLGKLAAGEHQFQTESLPAGTYLVRIQAGVNVQTKRLIVTR